MEDINYDGECTCDIIDWFADEDGFEGCPFCEYWDGFWEEGEDDA